jgi:hypothetical protein
MPKKKHILITKQIFFANKNILFYFYFVIYLARGHAPGTSETPVAAGFTFPPRARQPLRLSAWSAPGKPKGAGPSTDPAPCVLKWLWSKVSLLALPGGPQAFLLELPHQSSNDSIEVLIVVYRQVYPLYHVNVVHQYLSSCP